MSRLSQVFLRAYQISRNLLLICELYYIVNEILAKQMYRNIKKPVSESINLIMLLFWVIN